MMTVSGLTKTSRLMGAILVAGLLAACQDEGGLNHGRAYQPIPEATLSLMDKMGTTKFSPVLLRAFKKESELEVWKMKADGRYALLKTYPMCRWSGQLGPKRREGDRQVPEGFYSITPRHLNPNSAFYLSFNVGYPNAYDKAHGRNGSHIMVHGACSSRGCFSMTDGQIAEIYAIVREFFSGGQKSVQLQSLPFRMTPQNLAKHRLDKDFAFWKKLKEGADHFEVAKQEPVVMVCSRQYVFNAAPDNASSRVTATAACPPLKRDSNLVAAVQRKESSDQKAVAALIAKGTRPVKVVYKDGGQHSSFAHVNLVSRPEALAYGPVEIALDDRGRPMKSKPAAEKTQLAAGKPGNEKSKDTKVAASAKTQKSVVGEKQIATGKTKSQPVKQASNTSAKGKDTKPAAAGIPATAAAYTAAPAPTEAKPNQPLLRRWFGGLSGTPAPAAAKPAAALPQDRKVEAAPQAKPKRDKSVQVLPSLIRGAQRPLPAGLSAYATVR